MPELPPIRVCVSTGLDSYRAHILGEKLEGLVEIEDRDTPGKRTEIWVTAKATEAQLNLPKLASVIVPWAGVPAELCAQMAARPLKLYNLHHNAAATAEMAVGLLIAAARRIVTADRELRRGHWYGRMDDAQGVLLAGKRALILGRGAVGSRVASLLEALGMKTVLIGRSNLGDLNQELERSNALIICAPLTNETRGLIEAQRIRLLRLPRLLVNVGRGEIVHERHLFEACQSGVIFGAGIDTWYSYPGADGQPPVWPSKYPFHELGNVVLSPHRGGDGDQTEYLRVEALWELILDIATGSRRLRPVDPLLGY